MTRVPTTSSIPRILHQTYRDDKIPAKLATLQSSWLKHNPHWQYRFWSDNDIREFIAEHYADFLEVFDAYPHNIMRVDAFRYLLLHHHGGIYADLDFECLLPMDELLADQDILLIPEPEEHINKHKPRVRNLDYVVSNALMASVPGHPFWREVVELLKKSANNPDVLDATGPFILTYAHKDFTPTIPLANPRNFDGLLSDDHGKVGGRTEGVAQDVATDTPANIPMYARHHWAGTWWKRPLIIHIGVNILRSLRDFSLQRLSYNYRIREHIKQNHDLYYTSDTGKDCLPKHSRCITLGKGKIIGDELYNWENIASSADSPLETKQDLPQVSALMVTKDRPQLAWRAVECFIEQSYPNKELIIINDGGDDLRKLLTEKGVMSKHKISYYHNESKIKLGRLRNMAIKMAQGDYVCVWDDDDLYHKHRITYQMDYCSKSKADACFLLREIIMAKNYLAISGYRLWEHSMLASKKMLNSYPGWKRHEDYFVANSLVRRGRIVALDLPELYIYNYHGNNTWHHQHMAKIVNNISHQFFIKEDIEKKYNSLSLDYRHIDE